MHLKYWIEKHPIHEEMIWKNAAGQQFQEFFEFAKLLGGEPIVVSTHQSKSIELPVIEVTTPYGVRCILRDNFHDINASVWCPEPCNHDLFGLPSQSESYLFFQGFRPEWQLPPFVLGTSEFSLVLGYKTLLPFAQALRWLFWDEEGKPRDLTKAPASYPSGSYFENERTARRVAANSFFPMLYNRSTVSVTYRFFKADEPIEPDEAKLRRAFTRQAPGYDGKVKDEPIPHLTLNFTSGCPEPVDAWLRVLNTLVKERRKDPTVKRLGDHLGAEVKVTRLTPELRARIDELGCDEL